MAVDCGASEGLFGFLNHPRCRRVIVFEPNPFFLRCLERTFADNPRVEIVPRALASRTGRARFQLSSLDSSLSDGGDYEVELCTLDETASRLQTPIHFIKADLEGAELDFLAGAEATIAADKPRISITAYHDRSHAEEIERRLRRLVPAYRFRRKGYVREDWPTMLHAWV